MGGDLHELGELGIIDLFRQVAESKQPWVVQGIGDDCAVIDLGQRDLLLVTTDMLVERVHFTRETISPWQLGYKAMAVNLSDIAAMGGEPIAAFVAVAFSPDLSERFVRKFRDGLMECATAHDVQLLGGDTVAADRDLSICLTLLGRTKADQLVRRSGAGPTDGIYLGRAVGDSAAGLHLLLSGKEARSAEDHQHLVKLHLEPQPQLALGRLLAAEGLASAMIDVSDGVLQDLSHICRASGVGAEVESDALSVSGPVRRLAEQLGRDAYEWALTGGEDYCLLFCVPRDKERQAVAACRQGVGIEIFRIGTVKKASVLRVQRDGAWTESGLVGFDHFAGAGQKGPDERR